MVHSCDLVTGDYLVFPSLKKWPGGKGFGSFEEICALETTFWGPKLHSIELVVQVRIHSALIPAVTNFKSTCFRAT